MSRKPTYEDLELRVKGLEKEIAESQRAETAVKENFLKIVFDATQDGITVRDRDLTITLVNKWMEKKYKSQMPLVGKKCYAVFQKRSSPCPKCPAISAMESGKMFSEIVSYPSDDDPTEWFEITAFPIRNVYGELEGCIEHVKDITERRQAENALRESEEKYRSMMESMDDAAYICSPDFHVKYMNPAMSRRIGYKAINKLCHKVMHGLDEKCPWCTHGKVMQGENVKTEVVSPRDGQTYNISNSPIFHTDGSISQLTVFRNITETKKMEEQLRQAQKMDSIGTLAGGIAHDFNNILTSILGYTELSIDRVKNADHNVLDYLEIVQHAGNRARDLVYQILQFSRSTDINFKPIEIRLIVKEALKLLRALLPATIEIKQKIQPVTEKVMADESQIHQALMNLCTNAFHAMREEGGILHVELLKEEVKAPIMCRHGSQIAPGTYVVLLIKDTGCGMDNGMLQRIFEPYYTTNAPGEGTGLGLAVTNGIVKNHKGEICVESTIGVGSIFKLYFPFISEPEETKNLEGMPIKSGNEIILLVDDEEFFVDFGANVFTGLGYDVITATDSLKALEIFTSQPDRFDLVITDQTMPKMTGLELSRKLRAIRPNLPIIICTGFSESISGKTADQIGVSHILYKPPTIRDLALAARKVIDNG